MAEDNSLSVKYGKSLITRVKTLDSGSAAITSLCSIFVAWISLLIASATASKSASESDSKPGCGQAMEPKEINLKTLLSKLRATNLIEEKPMSKPIETFAIGSISSVAY